MSDPVLEASGLTKIFGRRSLTPLSILRGITLKAQPGQAIGLTGPSGVGKTTLLSCLSLIDLPTSGSLRLFGSSTHDLSDRARSELRREKIGFVFQNFQLLEDLPTWLNVCIGQLVGPTPLNRLREQALKLLEVVGMERQVDCAVRQLSGGEKQRLAYTRAVIGSPDLLFADEPTSNLDTTSARFLLNQIEALLESDVCVIMATHDASLLALCDHIYELRDGTLLHRNDSAGTSAICLEE